MTKKFLTLNELAEYLKLPRGTIYSWRARNYGPRSHKVGGAVRCDITDVEECLQGTVEHNH